MESKKRLIDANALWMAFSEKAEKIEIGVKDKVNKSLSKIVIHWCMDRIAIAPTVDAVEVVRCKDCKYAELDDDMYFCAHHGCDWNEGNHFCSYGERG